MLVIHAPHLPFLHPPMESFDRRFFHYGSLRGLSIDGSSSPPLVFCSAHAVPVSSQNFPRNGQNFSTAVKMHYDVGTELRKMCEEGRITDAVSFFELVHQGGLQLLPQNYAFLLQECAKMKAFHEGQRVHALLSASDRKPDVFLMNNLLTMYVKCGSLNKAKAIFDAMGISRDVVTWTLMIHAFVERSHVKEAMKLFFSMLKRNVKPNKITYVLLLKVCYGPEALDDGKRIHENVIKRHLENNTYVGVALMEMYIRCGSIKDARKVFHGISQKDTAVWSVLLAGYLKYGQFKEVLKAFHQLRWRYAIEPTDAMWIHALDACGSLVDYKQGKLLHACICESYFGLDDCLFCGLVHMYIKCGSLADAQALCDCYPTLSPSVRASMIAAYEEFGQHEEV